ncbi:hypothetical protein Leryth_015932 [Lithospermum erythrorhizon]|nr:hypothetical protein Leryth_015932 [Lithospermum erythrorhizon]
MARKWKNNASKEKEHKHTRFRHLCKPQVITTFKRKPAISVMKLSTFKMILSPLKKRKVQKG